MNDAWKASFRAASIALGAFVATACSGTTTPPSPNTGTAYLRFVMASPNANAVATTTVNGIVDTLSVCAAENQQNPGPNGGIYLPLVTATLDGTPLGPALAYGQASQYLPTGVGVHTLAVTCPRVNGASGTLTIVDTSLPPLSNGDYYTVVLAGAAPYNVVAGKMMVTTGASTLQALTFVDQNPRSYTTPEVTFYDVATSYLGTITVGASTNDGPYNALGSVTFPANGAGIAGAAVTVPVPATSTSPGLAVYAGTAAGPFATPAPSDTPYAAPTPQPTGPASPSPSPTPYGFTTSGPAVPGVPITPVAADPADTGNALPFNRQNHLSVFIANSSLIQPNPNTTAYPYGANQPDVPATPPPTLIGIFP